MPASFVKPFVTAGAKRQRVRAKVRLDDRPRASSREMSFAIHPKKMCGMTAWRDHFRREPYPFRRDPKKRIVAGPRAGVDLPRPRAGTFARTGITQ
jgi:hypothetical protein